MKSKILKISELVFDKELYPRMDIGWQTAYKYSQEMKAGSVFPPIIVGLFQGKLYVVDGWHRIRAKELLKEDHIQGTVKDYENYNDMFLDAIKLNISHGQPFSPQDKVRVIYKLENMNFELDAISKIVLIPMGKMEIFRSRTVIGPDGKPIFMKSIVAKAGADLKAIAEVNMESLSVRNISGLIEQLIELIRSGVFTLEDENVKKLAIELYGLLQEKLELTGKEVK